ncbi:MAG: diguanylate cyclase [Terracidiphilus sp.]|jgi:diguanylate cyclase (GGDEF)-like protein/PAS domain S-box-containing protein
MTDRTELLEAALDSLPEGIALIDDEGRVAFWNRSAEAITGQAGVDMVSHPVSAVRELLRITQRPAEQEPCLGAPAGSGALVHLRHKLGHDVPTMMRALVLRDALGGRIGRAAVFHPAESLDALPRGECSEGSMVEASQAEFEERLEAAFEDFRQGGESFGVVWLTVDQAHDLRKTHGARACDAMLDKVERVLANGLRPAEKMGRWGDDEYLVLSHERTPEMLAAHAQVLAGLARTADFRWWGDRVSITVSIGAAQAERDGSLIGLLEKAKAAMFSSFHAGGNQITSAPGGQACSPS